MARNRRIANPSNTLTAPVPKTDVAATYPASNDVRPGIYPAFPYPEDDWRELNWLIVQYDELLKPQTAKENRLVHNMIFSEWRTHRWQKVERELPLDTPPHVRERISKRRAHYQQVYQSSTWEFRKLRKQA